ncbi:MAG: T9SS type A sorting domain-containing protein [Bacteroidota bacterium]
MRKMKFTLLSILILMGFAINMNAQSKAISGSITSTTDYIPGSTMDIDFVLDWDSPDTEYCDEVILTFPTGMTPNSGTDIDGNAANAVAGQDISWGAGMAIMTPGVLNFSVNVTIDGALTGTQLVAYTVNGDVWGAAPHTFSGNCSILQLLPCATPTALTATNITTTSADLGWTETGTATQWNIELGYPGFIPGTGAELIGQNGTTSNPWPAAGGSPATTYEFYVQADCGGSGLSNWAGPYSFTTLCGTIATFPYVQNFSVWSPLCWDMTGGTQTTLQYDDGTTQCALGNFWNWNDGEEGWMTSPAFDVSSLTAPVLDFDWSHLYNASYPNDQLIVQVTDDGGMSWNTIFDLAGSALESADGATNTAPGSFVNSGMIDLSSYGTTLQFRFIFHSGYGPDCFVDNFRLRETPSCFDPSGLTATNITAVSADLGWTENGTATTWNIELGAPGFAPIGTPTQTGVTNPYTYSGLSATTTYDYYVQADCGGGDYSAWVGPFTFTTLCGAISTFPWTENFESIVTPAYPNCWFEENGDWTTTTNTSSTYDADAHSGTQFLRDAWTATNEYVWTPGFDLVGGTSYDFSFWWAGDNYSGWLGDVFYNTTQNSAGATQLGTSFVVPATTTTMTYQEQINTFVPATSGVYYFAIRVNEATGVPWYLSFDDFSLDLTPSCPAPNNLAAGNLTATSADLSWNEAGSATLWNIELGTTGFSPTGTPTQTGVTNPYNYSGLSASTSYDYYVQADCGGGDLSSWVGPFTFTTTASCPDPANLTAANILATSADLSWNGFFATLWDIELGTTGFTPSGTPTQAGVTNPYNYTGLTEDTGYDYYVRADCGGGSYSNWVGPFSFVTPLSPFSNPTACEIGVLLPDGDCEDYMIDVTTAPGTQLGTDVFLKDVNFIIEHTWDSDIEITLESPNGIIVDLTIGNGGMDDDYGIVNGSCDQFTNLNMNGVDGMISTGTAPFVGSYIPDGDFSDFNDGSSPIGLWTIHYCDSWTPDQGTLQYFELVFDIPALPKDLLWSGTSFLEAAVNDGSIETVLDLTLTNETFAATGILTETTHFTASNVPAGLSVEINVLSSNTASVTLTGNATNHADIDDISNMEITFLDAAFTGGVASDVTGYSQTAIVVDYYDPGPVFMINETDADQTGTDAAEFVELFDGGVGNSALDGYTVVFYNGSVDESYAAYDLDGYSTNADGYFVLGNSAVPGVDITFVGNFLQNGADAVALYLDDAASFPNGTTLTLTNLIDAVVYDTDDADDAGLLTLLNAGQQQINENGAGSGIMHSCSRIPNGVGGLRNTSTYVPAVPTPDAINRAIPELTWDNLIFTEDAANDGSVSTVVNLTLADETFSTTGILTETTHYNVANVPAGLTVEIDVTTPNTATITLTGNATNHADADDVANMGITFLDAAYTSIPAAYVVNNGQVAIMVDFMDPAYVDLIVTAPDLMNYLCGLTGTDYIPYCFTNIGTGPVLTGETVNISYQLPASAPSTDAILLSADLMPGDTICGMFTTPIDMSAIGTYYVDVFVDYSGDVDHLNDTIHVTAEHYEVVVDLSGVIDTIYVTAYPETLDAGACASPGGFNCTYMWSTTETTQTIDVNADGWYYVTVVDDNGCFGTDSVYVYLTIGVEDFSSYFGVNVYPNPNDGNFELIIRNNITENVTIELMNVQGQLIETRKVSGVEINEKYDASDLAKGVYYLRVNAGDRLEVRKVVIN